MRDSKKDDEGAARSLFLAGLMIGSVLVGGLFYDFESEGINLAPIIDSEVPDSILIGSVDALYVSINDEDMSSLDIEATLDGSSLNIVPNSTGIIIIDISEVIVGTHSLKMVVTDSLGQESRFSATFTIHYPYEDPTIMIVDNNEINLPLGGSAIINGTLIHPDLGTCDLGWSDGDVNEFSLNLPFSESGKFTWGPSEIESNMTISILATCGTWEDSSDLEVINVNITDSVMGCTDSEANNYDDGATEDDGSCNYDEEVVSGCTDSEANNYDDTATEDDGSCLFDEPTRLKILSLHGGGESASDFEYQQGMQDLMDSLTEFEFIFPETPEDGGVWVRDPPGGKEQGTNDPNWADESVNYLDNFIEDNGPFHGLLGFSQGAAMSAIYLAYSDVEFEKVILFNGYLETGHQGLNDTIENEAPFDIPALVFEGEDDGWFGYGSTELASIFSNVIHLVGDAGHHLPYSSDREFDNVVSFIRDGVEYGCTNSSASNFNQDANIDDGSCNYDSQVETGSLEWWSKTLICDDEPPSVDDYTTDEDDNHICNLSFVIEDGNITINTNGLPNHDFESTIGCCASAQSNSYILPLTPIDDPDCNPTVGTDGCVMAPELGTIAIAVNGVAIFGPEDGPGGDAVALEEGAYEQEEGEQQVDLGVCHGHSGPGGVYHYHADANCIHWHAEEGESMYDYHLDSQRTLSTHSKIVGFAFDGYPIYGYMGWDEDAEVVEMTSSYRLKDGQDGSGGIDDYEYIQGLGTLDACNGIFSATPDWPEGIYHYHTTIFNGEGGIGFPYFINCYAGEIPSSDEEGGDCSGHGETWGPGIGPPPDGCGGGGPGGQSSEGGLIAMPWLKNPPNSGLVLLSLLLLATVTRYSIRGSASDSNAPSLVGKVPEYHPIPKLA